MANREIFIECNKQQVDHRTKHVEANKTAAKNLTVEDFWTLHCTIFTRRNGHTDQKVVDAQIRHKVILSGAKTCVSPKQPTEHEIENNCQQRLREQKAPEENGVL